MAIKKLIEDVSYAVEDIYDTDFGYYISKNVPSSEDNTMTLARGKKKMGKVLDTCVLFVDIRDSVALVEKHQFPTMGKLYTAFTKAILLAAQYHNGLVRNIIGDRVMIVFPVENCFANAVDCAISINHVVRFVIAKKFKHVNIKCGIGIDYGKLRVVKVGVQRRGEERVDHKGLVWVGYPANRASRLTDVAGKTIERNRVLVTRYPLIIRGLGTPLTNYLATIGKIAIPSPLFDYSITPETVEMSLEEFGSKISTVRDGELSMLEGKYIRHEIVPQNISYKSILMTEAVYSGLKRNYPGRSDFKQNLWTKTQFPVKNIPSDTYEGGVQWVV